MANVVGVPLLAGHCLEVTKLVDPAAAADVCVHVHASGTHPTTKMGHWPRRQSLLPKAGLWEVPKTNLPALLVLSGVSSWARMSPVVPAKHLHCVPLGVRVPLLDQPDVTAELVRNVEDLAEIFGVKIDTLVMLAVKSRQRESRLEGIPDLAAVPNRAKLGITLPLIYFLCV